MKYFVAFVFLILSIQLSGQQTSAIDTPKNDSKWYWPFTFNGQRFHIGPTAANTLLWNDGSGIFWIDTTDVDNQVASEVPISDIGNNYNSTDVEGALQELGEKPFGEFYIVDSDPDTITFLSASTTPQSIGGTTQGLLSTSDISYVDGRLTYTGSKTVVLPFSVYVSYSFSENATDIDGWVYKNGAYLGKGEFHRTISTSGSRGSSSMSVFVTMATNDYLEVFMSPGAHTGDDEIIIYACGVLLGSPQF